MENKEAILKEAELALIRTQDALKKSEDSLRRSEILNQALIKCSKDCIKILDLTGKILWISDSAKNALHIDDLSTVIGKSWPDVWENTDERNAAKNALALAAKGETGDFVGHLKFENSIFWWNVIITPIHGLSGQTESLLAVSKDITSSIDSENILRDESQILEILNKTGSAISAKLDLKDLIQLVTDATTEICKAQIGALFYASKKVSGEDQLLHVLSGPLKDSYTTFGNPRTFSYFSEVFVTKDIIHHTDLSKDQRFIKLNSEQNVASNYSEIKSYLSVPIESANGEVIGSIYLGHISPGIFTDRTVRIVKGISSQAAIALDNSNLYESAQKEIEERKIADKDLKATQQELRMHQIRLESIIKFSEDAIITKNLEGIVQSWNDSAERIFGYKSSEAIGKPIQQLIIPPELWHEEKLILSKISRGERVEHLETERITKNGDKLFISVTSSPIKNLEGEIIGATKIARDITEKRTQQAALEQSEARYRALADEKSNLLLLESIARQQVEEANRIKDQFLATLSHELRTPLNAILGWAQLASRTLDNPARVKEGLNIIERNARSQAQIIEDLLDMNRIMSGTLQLQTKSVELSTVVDEAIETVLPSAESKKITIHKQYDESKTLVLADPNRLKQIIWNLLTNAIKFSNTDGIITVTIQNLNNHVKLVVSDQGEGITPDFLPFIFERFSQADISSSRRYGGLGLGLSIVRHLVELHNGEIKASSLGANKGTTFTVSLPITIQPHIVNEQHNQPVQNQENISPNLLKGLQVLVVDDEPDARGLVKVLLEERGAEVFMAASAKEGLNVLDKHPVDLIVSDIGMPKEDGHQFISSVRKLPKKETKNIPAIALTAFARNEDKERALKAGFQIHIAKPVEATELFNVIKKVLHK